MVIAHTLLMYDAQASKMRVHVCISIKYITIKKMHTYTPGVFARLCCLSFHMLPNSDYIWGKETSAQLTTKHKILTKEQISIHQPHISGNTPASTPSNSPTCRRLWHQLQTLEYALVDSTFP